MTAATDAEDVPFDAEAETVTEAWADAYLYTSWGYDQTNVTFAQIVEVSDSGKTVRAQLVASETVERTTGSDHLRPTADQYGDEFCLHVRINRNRPAFRGSYPYINRETDKGTRLDSFLPFTNTRNNTVRQTAPNHRH